MSAFKLTFDTLRHANTVRLPLFKNGRGEPAHSEPDGSDWTLGEWMTAVTGEVGEAANLIKKIKRGDLTIEEARPLVDKELADIVCYIDILAKQLGLDLGDEVVQKLNEISARVGAVVLIARPVELMGPAGHFVSVINVRSSTLGTLPLDEVV